MKTRGNYLVIIAMLFFIGNGLRAQETNSFNYQAVVRDVSGDLVTGRSVSVMSSILYGSEEGSMVYSETHNVISDDQGIISLKIGSGSPIETYIFTNIDWSSGLYYLETKIDINGGENYTLVGVSQLMSVPFANYALDVKNKNDEDADPVNELQTLFIDGNQLSISDGNTVSLPASTSSWETGAGGIYYNEGKVSIGKMNPVGIFEVKGDPGAAATDPLFQVISQTGDTVFAVYNNGVTVNINDQPVKGSIGGFAVSGRTTGKAGVSDYLWVTPDSVRVYVNNSAKGSIGGFAVSGRTTGKGTNDRFMDINENNCFIGYQSGLSISTGINNVFLGNLSGKLNESGNYNSFLGYKSGFNNTGGSNNLFLGFESGLSNTIGNNNTFVGYQSGYSNTTGSTNLFMGYQSGYSNTSGDQNLFIGRYSGYSNSTGSYNTFIGTQAGSSNTIGTDNLFIGTVAGVANTEGKYNIFLGSGAGNGNTTGIRNTFIGNLAGYNNKTGQSNICFGQYSGYGLDNGFYNIYIGTSTGSANPSGARNIAIGDQALYVNQTGYQNTSIGYQTGYSNKGYGNVYLGCYAGYSDVTGSNRLYIENSTSSKALIYGEFDRNMVVINGDSLDNLSEYTFYVNGTASGDFAWANTSDKKLKKNISTIESALDKVKRLRGVNYEWLDENAKEKGVRMGFIAQEAQKVIPEVVNTEGEYLSMQYGPITALLVEAMKEQQNEIDDLKTENEELKEKLGKIDDLQKQIDELKKMIK